MSVLARRPASLLVLLLLLGYFVSLTAALIWLRLGPDYILALTLGVIALVVLSLRPYLALHCFLFLLFFENAFTDAGGITVMKAFGVVILLGWLCDMLLRRRLGVSRSGLLLALIAFVFWSGICVPRALEGDTALVQFLTFVQMLLAAIMFSSLIETPKHMRWILVGLVAWTVVATVIAILMFYAGMTRVAVGFLGNRNLLALYINLAVPCALLAFPESPRPTQIGLALSMPVLLLGLALTLSRTGIVMLAVVMGIAWIRLARRRGAPILVGSGVAILGLLFLLPGAFWQRTEGIVPAIERRTDTFGLRVRIWQVGLKMIQDHPVMGVGTGNFVPASQRYARGEILGEHLASHNMYVHVAATMGLVGLALLGSVVWLALRYTRQAFRRAHEAGDRRLELSAMSVELMIVVMLGQGITGDIVQLKVFWVLFGLCMALRHLTAPATDTARQAATALARPAAEGAGA